jgi:hypothetical protein
VARLAVISEALARPSLRPTLRVNTLRTTPAEAIAELQRRLGDAAAGARPHPVVPSAVVLPGSGPKQPRYEELCGEAYCCWSVCAHCGRQASRPAGLQPEAVIVRPQLPAGVARRT